MKSTAENGCRKVSRNLEPEESAEANRVPMMAKRAAIANTFPLNAKTNGTIDVAVINTMAKSDPTNPPKARWSDLP